MADVITRHRVEVLPSTPSFLNLLLLADEGRRFDLSSLRLVPYGAEPMPAALLERLRAALPQVEFVQRFGTSETGALPVRSVGGGLALGTNVWTTSGRLWATSSGCAAPAGLSVISRGTPTALPRRAGSRRGTWR